MCRRTFENSNEDCQQAYLCNKVHRVAPGNLQNAIKIGIRPREMPNHRMTIFRKLSTIYHTVVIDNRGQK